jgi:hypothetical protein
MNAVKSFINNLPEGLGEKMFTWRDATGMPVLNDPAFFNNVLSPLMDAINPQATVATITGKPGISASDRISEIKEIIRKEPERYFKGPEAKKLQEELQKLVDYQAGQTAA